MEFTQPESKNAIREFLSMYDTNKDGSIDSKELGNFIRSQMGICISNEGLGFLRKSFDKNGDGKLQIDEIIDNMETINNIAVSGEDLINAFKTIDKKGSGFIRLPDLRAILMRGDNNGMSGEEASAILQELMVYDKNNDGKFSYPEFVDMLLHSRFNLKPPCQTKSGNDDGKNTSPKKSASSK